MVNTADAKVASNKSVEVRFSAANNGKPEWGELDPNRILRRNGHAGYEAVAWEFECVGGCTLFAIRAI
jgi:hypothetical protein